MADPKVISLLQGLNRVVVADLGPGRSLIPDDRLGETVTRSNQRRLEPLVNDRGLAPGTEQTDAWRALTEVVAHYADLRAADDRPPGESEVSARPDDQVAFEVALSRLHAESATPRLVQDGFPPDWVAALGDFQPAERVRHQVTAAAIVTAIAARTGRDEESVRTEMLAAGYGARSTAGARMLMASAPGYSTLPTEQQEEVLRDVAEELESGLASPTPDIPPTDPELSGDVENDFDLRGRVAVAWAGYMGSERIGELHEELRDAEKAAVLAAGAVRRPLRALSPVELPQSVYDLVRRVESEVRELTGAPNTLWNNAFEEWGLKPDQRIDQSSSTLRVRPNDPVYSLLTASGANGPLDAEQAAAARTAIDQAMLVCARSAVPERYGLIERVWADALRPRFDPIERGVLEAFVENDRNRVVGRVLPRELAEQLRTPEPPSEFESHGRTPATGSEYAAAAQGFAGVVHSGDPDELIRRLAGEGPQDMAMAAGEVLVAGSTIPPEHRQQAAWVLGEQINDHFAVLPDRLEEWRRTAVLPTADLARRYGAEAGQIAERLVADYGNDPELLNRDVAAAGRRLAAAVEAERPGMPPEFMDKPRLVPGVDRAMTRRSPVAPGIAAAPDASGTAAAPVAPGQPPTAAAGPSGRRGPAPRAGRGRSEPGGR